MLSRLTGYFVAAFVAAAFIGGGAAAAELRIALVIGNGGYETAPLNNPVNDARLMAATLRGVGFEVIERIDADQKAMKRAIQEFGERLEQAGQDGVGLFYFSGHGVQVGGVNYLIPIDTSINRESDVDIEAVSANVVLGTMEYARNRLNIVILDACRNNPYARSFRSAARGLARMDAPRGTLVAYATAPGGVAFDGEGANSPYTSALAQAMQAPGLKVEEAFKQVRLSVMAETGEQQVPWEASSLTGDFYFNATGAAAQSSQPASASPSTAQQVDSTAIELAFWQSIENSDNPADFDEFLKKFPDGVFAGLARNRLAGLKEKQTALVVAPTPQPQIASSALIAHWSFDACSASDDSGNGYDGVIHGAPRCIDGVRGKAFRFDGREDYIDVVRMIQDDFTISVWLRSVHPTATGSQCYRGNGVVWSDVNWWGDDFILSVLNDRLCMFTGSPDRSVLSQSIVIRNQWLHLAASRSRRDGRVRIYVEGRFEEDITASTDRLDGNPRIHIAADTLTGRYFKGDLDEISIYNRVLTHNEIRQLARR